MHRERAGVGVAGLCLLARLPEVRVTAVEIDAGLCALAATNAARNAVAMGAGQGALTMLVAGGMAHPLLAARGPYDLIVANILAGPLCELARQLAGHLRPGGLVLLAGILAEQAEAVACVYASWFDIARCGERDGWVALLQGITRYSIDGEAQLRGVPKHDFPQISYWCEITCPDGRSRQTSLRTSFSDARAVQPPP